MLKLKRFLNLKTIALAATLFFIVVCYFAVRKVMVWDVELGMSRETVVAVMGMPTSELYSSLGDSSTYIWISDVINKKVYRRTVMVSMDSSNRVTLLEVINAVFGWEHLASRY